MLFSHKVAKHLHLKRAGLAELSFASSPLSHDDFCPPKPSFPNYRSATSISAQRRTWLEPDHGLALRVPPLKQAKTARGHTFYNDLMVYHESELEQRTSEVLKTYRGLKHLISQYPKLEFFDDDGVVHEHTLDYMIELSDGTKIGIAVKYEKKREQMDDLLERLCANGLTGVGKNGKMTPGIVDAVALVTDAVATQLAFENAYFLLASRDDYDAAECEAVIDLLPSLPPTFRFGQLLKGLPVRGPRRTAIYRLLDLGILEPVSHGRLDELAWLRAA